MDYIKANIPDSEDKYMSGNGEGVWVLVDEVALAAYNNDEAGTVYYGILDNDSWYYPCLTHGMRIPLEMRGDCRPVVPYQWIIEQMIAIYPRKDVLY